MLRVLALCILIPVALLAQLSPAQRAFTAYDALDVVSASAADLSADGRWLAVTSSTRRDGLGVDYRRDGDPSYIRPSRVQLQIVDTESGKTMPLITEPTILRAVSWSPDATSLAALVVRNDHFVPVIWDRATGRMRTLAVPAGLTVAENSPLTWTKDGRQLLVALRSERWQRRVANEFARMTAGPIFVQDGTEPFLAWDAMRREGNVRSIYLLDAVSGRASEVLNERMIAGFELSPDDSLLVWEQDRTSKTDYDVIFGTENTLKARARNGGEEMTVLATLKGTRVSWAHAGQRFAYSRDGSVFVTSLGSPTPRKVAGPDSAARQPADTSEIARRARANERFTLLQWSPKDQWLLLSNPQGYWTADAATGARTMLLATDTAALAPRYAPVGWSPDDRFLYFSYASRTQWERGIVRIDRTTGTREDLLKDGRLYQGSRLAERGDRIVFAAGPGNRPLDLYAADASLRSPIRLTTSNESLSNKALARTQMVRFRDVDGVSRVAVVYLPADYQTGQRYPTLFSVYEEFYDDTFDTFANVMASNGYVVVKPSVGFDIGFPGEAWLKGVTSAANEMIALGIADSAKMGVFGTSYGGYATNLLITQTKRFKAAVNVSGKVDVISFYTDSPRLGVRNTHAAEKSQDRLGATLWQQPQKYIAASAVMFADRITTPLMLITGAQDSNVPADNTREMYYALRRLGKEVVWVNYMNSGHGTPGTNAEEYVDYHDRFLAFFGKHLKGESGERVVEATSLFGEPLYRPSQAPATRARMLAQLDTARVAYEHTPQNADSLIWYGRRTGYLGRFNEAIDIFSQGAREHPTDARMLRHRGHRYLSIRQLDLAIRDFEKAVQLVKGKADDIEPDGQPNARGIPTSSLQSNIWYHLGLAYYLKADFNNALRAYKEHLRLRNNPDGLVAMSHWQYMALRKLGRDREAAAVLVPITKDMDIIENTAYHKLLLLYKGELTEQEVLPNFGADGALEDVTVAYGVGNWHLYNGRPDQARAIFGKILATRSQWASFGYLAAEAEMRRLERVAEDAGPAPTQIPQ